MVSISIFKEEDYKIDFEKIKKAVLEVINEKGKFKAGSVGIAIVGEKKMEELNKKYYKDKVYLHPVFTFSENEKTDFVFPPGKKHLGEIVISYQQALETAYEKKMSIDESLSQLVKHAALHLIGIHHEL